MCRCPERDKIRSLPRTPTSHGFPQLMRARSGQRKHCSFLWLSSGLVYPNADIVVDDVTYLPQDGGHTTNIGTSATKRAPEGMTLEDRRRYEGITRRYIRRLVGHAFLSPELVEAILQGRQPVELTATRLTELDLPLD
jgi:hypothetical protein